MLVVISTAYVRIYHVSDTKYLDFSFCDSKGDDNEMLSNEVFICYKPNKLLRTFSHCSTNVKLTLFQRYCITLYFLFL